ncbi:hypothetical protein GFS24_28195 [Chitinophaga sp. SYP-B3965]|uniref:hypothetical protein n=1 Tax=Chitinophaga sp. SYP-B3965 TaxID=2663120 RepID=UPI0012995BFF|nr:hypothetical protein [Chitinophaga sp. SYP-B3965]MRG49023.1 hypothetical protein [Chitinophaga sp. SYP-B3965]
MKHTVIAISGGSSIGKSTAVNAVIDVLPSHFPGAIVEFLITGGDNRVIVTIGDIKIGIESQGDPGSRLPESLKIFLARGCQIIICATRTSGGTVNAVQALQDNHQFDVIWTKHYSSKEKHAATPIINQFFAEHMAHLVRQLINGVI